MYSNIALHIENVISLQIGLKIITFLIQCHFAFRYRLPNDTFFCTRCFKASLKNNKLKQI